MRAIQPGDVIAYVLQAVNPERQRQGCVTHAYEASRCYEVEVQEKGYEGLSELVFAEQIQEVWFHPGSNGTLLHMGTHPLIAIELR